WVAIRYGSLYQDGNRSYGHIPLAEQYPFNGFPFRVIFPALPTFLKFLQRSARTLGMAFLSLGTLELMVRRFLMILPRYLRCSCKRRRISLCYCWAEAAVKLPKS